MEFIFQDKGKADLPWFDDWLDSNKTYPTTLLIDELRRGRKGIMIKMETCQAMAWKGSAMYEWLDNCLDGCVNKSWEFYLAFGVKNPQEFGIICVPSKVPVTWIASDKGARQSLPKKSRSTSLGLPPNPFV